MADILGLIIGAVITLVIFSYVLGDNVLYRWALALLVGCAVGYATGVAVRLVLEEWITPALAAESLELGLVLAIPLALGGLLLLKGFPPTRLLGRIAVLGNIPLGYLVGVGAAVAISGAVTGTLIPQVLATGDALKPESDLLTLLQGVIVLLGTVFTLLYFAPRPTEAGSTEGERSPLARWSGRLGQFFLIVALGTAFSGAITSALTALVMRLWRIAELLRQLVSLGGM